MKKKYYLSSIILSSLIVNQNAYAETPDARSAALGGATLGQANNAFAPMRNPASMIDSGWGSFILPLSPVITFGDASKPISAFTDLLNSSNRNTAALNLVSGLFKNDSARLETQAFLPIIGFSGTPFSNLSVMGQPIALGLNLWGRGSAVVNFNSSKGLGQLISNTPALFSSVSEIQKQSAGINSQFSSVRSLIIPDVTKFQNVNPLNQSEVNAVIDEVQAFQNTSLKPIILNSDNAVNSITKVTTDIKNILDSFEDLSKNKQSAKGTVVADGHAVIAVSGASQVFRNDVFDISLGINLKGFFFPANTTYSSIAGNNSNNSLLNIIGGQGGSNKLIPVTVNADIQTGAFKSIGEIKNIVDNKLSPLVQSARDIITTAKTLDSQLDAVIPKARESSFNVIGDVPAIQNTVNTLQTQSRNISSSLSTDFSQTLITEVQNSLANDLKDVKINLSQMSDVAPLGFGMDIGAQIRVLDDIVLGLVLENPLVLWPAKVKNNQMTFDSNKLQESFGKANVDISSLFTIVEDKNPQTANYNMSEPFAIKFGGSYSLNKLSPFLREASFVADLEQVFNGRPFAAHLGVEKGWSFRGGQVFLRLGTQLGGIGNMFTAGLGAKSGPFNISLGYGAGNPFNPTGSNAAIAALSTSLSF